MGVKTIAGGSGSLVSALLRVAIGGPKFYRELPFHAAFLSRINLRDFGCFTKQKSSDVVEQKRLRVGVREVKAVVVDDLCLLLQPATDHHPLLMICVCFCSQPLQHT